jgi:hypothetical protein
MTLPKRVPGLQSHASIGSISLQMFRFMGVLALLLTTIQLFVVAQSPAHDHASPQPMWTLDLRQNGYSSDPFTLRSAFTALRQIAFGSNSELVVLNDSGICGESNPATAFVVNSTSGKLLRKANVVTNCWPYTFATAKGNYAIVTSRG